MRTVGVDLKKELCFENLIELEILVCYIRDSCYAEFYICTLAVIRLLLCKFDFMFFIRRWNVCFILYASMIHTLVYCTCWIACVLENWKNIVVIKHTYQFSLMHCPNLIFDSKHYCQKLLGDFLLKIGYAGSAVSLLWHLTCTRWWLIAASSPRN